MLTTFQRSRRCTICEIFQRSRRRRRDCRCHYYCHYFCRFFFFVCCFDRFDLFDFFDFDDLILNENACFDICSSRDNNVKNECIFFWNDDQILNRKHKNKNDDYHDHDEFDENETIDANI